MTVTKLPHGSQKKLAARVGVSKQYFNDVIHRRRHVKEARAKEFAIACEELGFSIPWEIWYNNETTNHPVFKGGSTVNLEKYPEVLGASVDSDLLL